jgi:hypothetical protein
VSLWVGKGLNLQITPISKLDGGHEVAVQEDSSVECV